ncbi:MAG TPA: Panacea domain-containing protein [Longimicrobium sp.]|nr:Panacea domain-containing protein [Longimicrobium sp.]
MNPSVNERMVQFFAQRAGGRSLGITQLQKLFYMADLHAREYLGRPISTLNYTFYRHGPFDKQLYRIVDRAGGRKWIRKQTQQLNRGESTRIYDDGPKEDELGFSPAELHVLDYVARTYEHMPLDELLDTVYRTEPMKAAGRDGRVPMEMVDNRARRALGYHLEEVLGEEDAIRRGDSIAASDFFDALHAGIVPGDSPQHPGIR